MRGYDRMWQAVECYRVQGRAEKLGFMGGEVMLGWEVVWNVMASSDGVGSAM